MLQSMVAHPQSVTFLQKSKGTFQDVLARVEFSRCTRF